MIYPALIKHVHIRWICNSIFAWLHYIWNVVSASCSFWKTLDWSYLDNLTRTFFSFFACLLNNLQISEVVNCMKDLIDYTTQDAGKGPIGKLKETSPIWYTFFFDLFWYIGEYNYQSNLVSKDCHKLHSLMFLSSISQCFCADWNSL